MKTLHRKTSPKQPPKSPSLVGQFFHSYKNAEIEWQGEVLADMGRAFHLIRLFGWWDGEETERRVVPLETLATMRFYASVEEMRNAYECHRHRMARADRPGEENTTVQ